MAQEAVAGEPGTPAASTAAAGAEAPPPRDATGAVRLPGIEAATDLPRLHNRARHRPASQSSTSRWSRPGDAQGAVKGYRTGGFGFHTAVEASPWWQVDLGEIVPVRYVVAWNRETPGNQGGRDIALLFSEDGTRWEAVHATGEAGFGGARTGTPLVVDCADRPARFVQLRRAVRGALSLDEVEVFGPAPDRAAGDPLEALCRRLGEDPAAARRLRGRPAHAELRFAEAAGDDALPGSITLLPYGRLGNAVYQLVAGLHVALAHGIPRLCIGDLRLPVRAASRRIGPIEVTTARADGAWGPDLRINLYSRKVLPATLARLDDATERRIGQEFVRPLLADAFAPRPAADLPTLHVHLRAGDIFRLARPNPEYVQPPLAFYRFAVRDAVERLGIRQVVLVHEDEANPCIPALRAWLDGIGMAHRTQSATLAEDIGELLSARHLVVAQGSFSYPIFMLSDALRTVYGFGAVAYAGLLASTGARRLVVTDVARGYMANGTWQNLPEQRQQMLDYPIEALRLSG